MYNQMVYGIIIKINGICINLDGSEWALDLEKMDYRYNHNPYFQAVNSGIIPISYNSTTIDWYI